MTISKHVIIPVGWLTLSAITFALGWHLRPARVIETVRNEAPSRGTVLPTATERRLTDAENGTSDDFSINNPSLTPERITALGDRFRSSTDRSKDVRHLPSS